MLPLSILQKSIASFLEVNIDDVKVSNDPNDEKWFDTLQAWLKPKNLFFLEVRIDVAVHYPLYAMNGIYCIFSGKSPREFEGYKDVNHCVVGMLNTRVDKPVVYTYIHDPHPDNQFLKENTLWGLGFICVIDPSKPVGKNAI